MGTGGYFGYRYKRKYYRQYLSGFACPYLLGHGQRLVGIVPRDSSAFKDWVADRIMMLENAKTIGDIHDEVVHPDDGIGADDLGFKVTYDLAWTFPSSELSWTYVIDLDHLVFTINGTTHLRLDHMPPNLDGYIFSEYDERPVSEDYLCPRVNLWPAPNFDIEERQQKYEALQPIIVPVTEWGAPTWDELSASQRFSIEITHYLLRTTSYRFASAYAPSIRRDIGEFCWNVLCASVPALPIFQEGGMKNMNLPYRTLSCGWTNNWHSLGAYVKMHSIENQEAFKLLDTDYCWIRDCLVTFCAHFNDPIYVAHEVEQMVEKMRHDGHPESVGIILSSQQELVVVAVDGHKTRHSPVLDIRTTPRSENPGGATDGRLLLTYLLSPPLTVSPLPWRTQPRMLPCFPHSIIKLPPEVLQMIIRFVDMGTYLTLCRVSRSVHSICVANPRVGPYTILHRIPGFETIFAAQCTDDGDGALKMIDLQCSSLRHYAAWEPQKIAPGELDDLRRRKIIPCTDM
ncbi:F-box protein [Rhizoctonia solani AG-3 Rhs1AP]|uniref:F-box protein n=1 Tax=Rhizoctonia solani AG-3 Rhs1AP TaxID=1086054 RepID=X8JGT3_9AGAM|nr:F-box protein [Rhizoctonia solani AG-3 Rhs1AP]